MKQAAIYVRAPLAPGGSIISTENQETACRDYCTTKNLSIAAIYADKADDGSVCLWGMASSPKSL